MSIFFSGPPPTINEFATNSGTIYGHPNAAGAEAVDAARYFRTPPLGFPRLSWSFSLHLERLRFYLTWQATPDLRAHKPEIVAPDDADTTFFGSDIDGTDSRTSSAHQLRHLMQQEWLRCFCSPS